MAAPRSRYRHVRRPGGGDWRPCCGLRTDPGGRFPDRCCRRGSRRLARIGRTGRGGGDSRDDACIRQPAGRSPGRHRAVSRAMLRRSRARGRRGLSIGRGRRAIARAVVLARRSRPLSTGPSGRESRSADCRRGSCGEHFRRGSVHEDVVRARPLVSCRRPERRAYARGRTAGRIVSQVRVNADGGQAPTHPFRGSTVGRLPC